LAKALHERSLLLAQLQGGVVLGIFANCPLSDPVASDPALKSAIFVLEHPTGEQRKWQAQVPNYDVMLNEEGLELGAGLCVDTSG
jgi:hypothetical protein